MATLPPGFQKVKKKAVLPPGFIKVGKVAAPTPAPKEKDSGFTDFREGIAESGIRTYLGVKDLFGKASDAEKASLADLSTDAAESGWGMGGNVVGDIAQLAIPGGMGVKAAKLASAVKAARYLPLAVDVLSSAGYGAAQLPKAGQSRTGNAVTSGAGALAGAGLSKSLSMMGKGVKLTPAAERLRDMGIQVTPGQSIKGVKGFEDISGWLPFLARSVRKAKKASQETAHIVALKQALPPGGVLTKTGHEGVKQLKDGYSAAYTAAWGGADNLASDAVPNVLTVALRAPAVLGKKHTATLRGVENDIIKLVNENTAVSGKQVDEIIRHAIGGTKKTRKLDAALKEMRQTLRAGLPKESQAALTAIDAQYPKYLIVKEAAKARNAVGDLGHFKPTDLLTGVKKIGGDRVGTGEAPMQGYLNDVMATVGQKDLLAPITGIRRFSALFPTVAPLGQFAKMATGQLESQKMLKKALESEAAKKLRLDQLRYGLSGARLGAAYTGNKED